MEISLKPNADQEIEGNEAIDNELSHTQIYIQLFNLKNENDRNMADCCKPELPGFNMTELKHRNKNCLNFAIIGLFGASIRGMCCCTFVLVFNAHRGG